MLLRFLTAWVASRTVPAIQFNLDFTAETKSIIEERGGCGVRRELIDLY